MLVLKVDHDPTDTRNLQADAVGNYSINFPTVPVCDTHAFILIHAIINLSYFMSFTLVRNLVCFVLLLTDIYSIYTQMTYANMNFN